MVLHATLTHPWNVLSARRRFPKGRDLVKIPEKRKQVRDDGNMEDSRRKKGNTNTLWSFGSDVALITGRSVGLPMPKKFKKVFWESWKRRLPCMTFKLLSWTPTPHDHMRTWLTWSTFREKQAARLQPHHSTCKSFWCNIDPSKVRLCGLLSSELDVELSHWDMLRHKMLMLHKFASTNCVRRDFLARTFQVSRSRGSEQLNACWQPIPSYQKWYPIWSPYLCTHFTVQRFIV